MAIVTGESTALRKLLTCAAENSALYAALTESEGLSEIAGRCAEDGYRLIRVDDRLGTADRDKFEIALVDDAESSVAYYLEATVTQIPEVCNRSVIRSQSWRSASVRHSVALHEISKKVFFSYLIQHYDILLVADESVMGSGIYLWQRHTSYAIEKGLHVYAFELTTQKLRSIPTQCALDALQDQAWLCANRLALRAIVSVAPLVSL